MSPRHGKHPSRLLLRDQRGASALEFALVAPLLILLLLGVADLAPTTMAKFKTANATQSAADLATQFSDMQPSDMVNVFAGGADVLAPFSGANLVLRITNVAADGQGNAFVYWSCGQGALPPYEARSSVTRTPTGSPLGWFIYRYNVQNGSFAQNGTNTSFVMVESRYVYTAPARAILPAPQTMTSVAYMLPRVSSYVGFPWDGDPQNEPTAPASATDTGSITLSNGAECNYAN